MKYFLIALMLFGYVHAQDKTDTMNLPYIWSIDYDTTSEFHITRLLPGDGVKFTYMDDSSILIQSDTVRSKYYSNKQKFKHKNATGKVLRNDGEWKGYTIVSGNGDPAPDTPFSLKGWTYPNYIHKWNFEPKESPYPRSKKVGIFFAGLILGIILGMIILYVVIIYSAAKKLD